MMQLQQHVRDLETSLRTVHVCACGRVCTMEEAVNAASLSSQSQPVPACRTMSYPEALKAARARRAQHKAQHLQDKGM